MAMKNDKEEEDGKIYTDLSSLTLNPNKQINKTKQKAMHM